MEKILVAGATGTTGKQIIDLLYNNQYFEPIAMVRKEEQKEAFKRRGISTVIGDLSKDISDTTMYADKVIFAAGSGGEAVEAVDRNGAMRLIDAARIKSLKKFVMLSSMGADQPENASELQEYLKAKHDADEYLKQSGLPYTIVRPGSLTDELPTGRITLEQKISDNKGDISRADVAQVLVRCLHDDVANNETFEILSGKEIIADAFNKIQVEEA